MSWKAIYGVAFLLGIGCTIILLMIVNHGPARPSPAPMARVAVKQPPKVVPPAQPAITSVEIPAEPEPIKQSEPTKVAPPTAPVKRAAPSTYQEIRSLDPVVKEQIGRYALSFVGADPVADEVWASLIYDPSLSEKVREDLMEDLNENGFSDGNGRVPTIDDLPLIESRIVLLAEHIPYADEFMREHLEEAYKDLGNMWLELRGR